MQFLCIRPGNTISPFIGASFRGISFPVPPLHVCPCVRMVCVCVCVHVCAWCVCVCAWCVCGAQSGSAGSAWLAGVEVSALSSGFLSLASAGQAGAAVAALEDLQTLSSFPPVTRAHLPLRQHGLTDPWPEVSGTAEPFHTVRRPETRLALATWQIIHHISVHLCEIKHVWSTGSFEFSRVNLRRDETTARWKKVWQSRLGILFWGKKTRWETKTKWMRGENRILKRDEICKKKRWETRWKVWEKNELGWEKKESWV